MVLPGCLFVGLLILLLVCFLFNFLFKNQACAPLAGTLKFGVLRHRAVC